MPFNLRTPSRPAKPYSLEISDFRAGSNTILSPARQNPSMSPEILNMIQTPDGWETRWGINYYGAAIEGESGFLGGTTYINASGAREIILVGATTGNVYSSTDNAATWEPIDTGVFTTGYQVYFLQINQVLYMSNRHDPLSIYNGTDIDTYTEIVAPTIGTITRGAGLSTGSYNLYYQVTAFNEVGETAGSTEGTIAVNKPRDSWTAADEYIDIPLTAAVSGATRYQLYYSDESGYEAMLEGANSTSTTIRDDGTYSVNPYREVPDDNTTGAPIFGPMELSDNRLWATGDPNNKWRIYATGTGQFMGVFSIFYGGVFIDIEKGGKEQPMAVTHFRKGNGDSAITVLTTTPDGTGSIWQITLSTLTIGSYTVTVPLPVKIVGSVGSGAPLATIKVKDNIMFPNAKGVYALRSKAQLFNILATDEQSVNFRPDYRKLSNAMAERMCGVYYNGKVLFSGSWSGVINDRTFVYDSELNNWAWYWDKGFRQFFEFTENTTAQKNHLLAIPESGNQLWELSEDFTNDLGDTIHQVYSSPLLPVGKDKTTFVPFASAFAELGELNGTANFEVYGNEFNKNYRLIKSREITKTTQSTSDFVNELFGDVFFSDNNESPRVSTEPSTIKRLRLGNRRLNKVQFRISANTKNTKYRILSLQATDQDQVIPSNWN